MSRSGASKQTILGWPKKTVQKSNITGISINTKVINNKTYQETICILVNLVYVLSNRSSILYIVYNLSHLNLRHR